MKLFVWDLHGVLEKGNEGAVLEISNQILQDFGYTERFTTAQNHTLYGSKWYQYFEFILPRESHERNLELQEASFRMSDTRPDIMAKHVRPNDHVHTVLQAIARQHAQIVISNTKPYALNLYLQAAQLTDYFGTHNAFAVDMHRRDARRTKQHVLAEYLAADPASELIIIGDSPSDMALAEVAGGTRYLYTHPGRQFKDCVADHRIHDLREVLASL